MTNALPTLAVEASSPPLPSAINPLPTHAEAPLLASLRGLPDHHTSRWTAILGRPLTLAMLETWRADVSASLQASSPSHLMAAVDFLKSRYPATRPADEPRAADMDLEMWVNAVGHWPMDVMKAAVFAYAKAEKFAPNAPADLLPYGDPIMASRWAIAQALARMIAALRVEAGRQDVPQTKEERVAMAAQLTALASSLGGKRLPERLAPRPLRTRAEQIAALKGQGRD